VKYNTGFTKLEEKVFYQLIS